MAAKNEKLQHVMVPEHVKLSEKEKKELMEKFNVTLRELPKISSKDPAIAHLDVKEQDVIKIIRKSETAKETFFYRGVIND